MWLSRGLPVRDGATRVSGPVEGDRKLRLASLSHEKASESYSKSQLGSNLQFSYLSFSRITEAVFHFIILVIPLFSFSFYLYLESGCLSWYSNGLDSRGQHSAHTCSGPLPVSKPVGTGDDFPAGKAAEA